MAKINQLVLVLFTAFASASSYAYLSNEKTPLCLDAGEEMKVDNERILKLKRETKNQHLDRGYVSGTVNSALTVVRGHQRFMMKIGPGAKDDLEVIYNVEFGTIPPQVRIGDAVTVCGDYITSNAATPRYEASPAGAIIHWVHYNPGDRASSRKHEHGFVQFGSTLVGFDKAPAGAWTGRIGGGRGRTTTEMEEDGQQPSPSRPAVSPAPSARPQATARPQPSRPQASPIPAPSRPAPSASPQPSGRGRNPGQPAGRRWVSCRTLEECRARNPGFENESL